MSRLWTFLLVITIVAVMACAPRPVTSSPATNAPAATAALSKPEDDAWAKVVQEAKKEGTVTLFTFDLAGDAGQTVAKAFKDKYGITLELLGLATLTETPEKIKTEYRTEQHTTDMMETSILLNQIIADLGFSARLIDLPVFSQKDIWRTPVDSWDKEGRNLITYSGLSGLFVNTKLVNLEDYPKSWYDLLDPKLKGQITVLSPVIVSTLDFYYHILEVRGILEKGYFEKLGKQDLIFATEGMRGTADRVARGEAKVGLISQGIAMPFVRQGAPLKAVTPKEGIIGSSYGVTMLTKAPHPNATRLFINWLFSQEGNNVFHKATTSPSNRKDVPDFLPDAVKMSQEKVYVITPEEYKLSLKTYKEGLMAKMLGAKK